jgi:hypothetical protein
MKITIDKDRLINLDDCQMPKASQRLENCFIGACIVASAVASWLCLLWLCIS